MVLTLKVSHINFLPNNRVKMELFQEEKSGFRKFLRMRVLEIISNLSVKGLKEADKEKLEIELENVLHILEAITNVEG